MKKWPKGYLLAAACLTLLAIGQVSGFNQYVATKLNDVEVDDIKLNGNDILDSAGTTRVTVGATNTITGNATITGNLTASGTSFFTVNGSTAPRDTSATIGLTPTAIAQFAWNSTDKELCISTGVTRFTWVRVSTPTAACAH